MWESPYEFEMPMPKLSTKSDRYESIKSSIAMILGPEIDFDLDMNTAYYIHGLAEPYKHIAILQEVYNVLWSQNREPDRQKGLLDLIKQKAKEATEAKAKNQPVYYDKLVDENEPDPHSLPYLPPSAILPKLKKPTGIEIDVEKLKLEKSILDKEVQIKEYKKKVQAIDEYKPLPKLANQYKDFAGWNSGKLSNSVTQVDKGALTVAGIDQLAAQIDEKLAGTINSLIANTEVKTELQNAAMTAQYKYYTNINDLSLALGWGGVTKVTANPLPASPAPVQEPKRIVYVEEKIGRKFREE